MKKKKKERSPQQILLKLKHEEDNCLFNISILVKYHNYVNYFNYLKYLITQYLKYFNNYFYCNSFLKWRSNSIKILKLSLQTKLQKSK